MVFLTSLPLFPLCHHSLLLKLLPLRLNQSRTGIFPLAVGGGDGGGKQWACLPVLKYLQMLSGSLVSWDSACPALVGVTKPSSLTTLFCERNSDSLHMPCRQGLHL